MTKGTVGREGNRVTSPLNGRLAFRRHAQGYCVRIRTRDVDQDWPVARDDGGHPNALGAYEFTISGSSTRKATKAVGRGGAPTARGFRSSERYLDFTYLLFL